MTAQSIFGSASLRYAECPAYVDDGGRSRTWAELADQTDRIAAGLASLGAGRGDRVVLALPNSPGLLALEHAVLRAGLVRVSLGGRAHPDEVAAIARDAAALVLADVDDRGEIRLSTLESGRSVTLRELLDASTTRPDGTFPAVAPDDLAMLMYSSGSTGEPKAAAITQRMWTSCTLAMAAHLPPLGPGDVVVQAAPMSHFGGSVGLVAAAYGAATVVLARFDPAELVAHVLHHRATIVPLAPTLLRRLVDHLHQECAPDVRRRFLDLIRCVPYGGSAIPAEELARAVDLFEDTLVQFYGLAEALTPISVLSGRDHLRGAASDRSRLASAGRVATDVELSIVDDAGNPAVQGDPGEIRVRGDRVIEKYWRRPELSAEALRDGWFATGDIGYERDGMLHIVDRRKDVIVSGGYNVYPAEVEQTILALPDVAEVAVIGVPDERWGEGVAAIVCPREGSDLSADDVVATCRERLAGHKKPVRVEFLPQLPRNGATKVDKQALRARYWADHARRVSG